jgi:hypothetical protein
MLVFAALKEAYNQSRLPFAKTGVGCLAAQCRKLKVHPISSTKAPITRS